MSQYQSIQNCDNSQLQAARRFHIDDGVSLLVVGKYVLELPNVDIALVGRGLNQWRGSCVVVKSDIHLD